MKRFTFKPVMLFTALFTIPAAAQAAGPELNAKDLAALKLKLKFVGDSLQIEGSDIPLICVQNLKGELKSEPVEGGKEKLKTATSVEGDDLKNYVTKVTPSFKFTTIAASKEAGKEKPEVRNLSQCLEVYKDAEKADLAGKDKISLELDQPKEAAYVETGSDLLKNPAYVKLESDVKRINCKDNCNDTPEKVLATLKSVDRDALAGIVAKLESSVDQMLLDYVAAVDSAKAESDLEIVRSGLVKFSKDVEASSLSEDTKKDLQGKISAVLVQGIPAKELTLCQEEASAASFSQFGWTNFSAAATTRASGDMWSKYRAPSTKKEEKPAASTANRCVDFMVKSIETSAGLPRLDAATRKENAEVSKQLRAKDSDARTDLVAQIDPKDPTVMQALHRSDVQFRVAQQRLAALQCDRVQSQYQFTHCGIALEQYNKHANFLQTYGQRFQAAQSQDQLLFNTLGSMSYSNSRTASSSPFALNPSVFPEAAKWNAQSGMNYQNTAFDPSLMYKPQSEWNRMTVDPRANSTLPVAIPLNPNGMPSQSMQARQFQA